MSLVHVDERKWGDRPHWQLHPERLGEDEHGVWLYGATGSVVQRGNEPPMSLPHGFLMLIPKGEWWLAEFYLDHPTREIYINIGTPPEWFGDRVTQIDLDLDVARERDGSVVVLDEDEFDLHRAAFDYPDDVIAHARQATDRAVRMLTQRIEPYNVAAERWFRVASDQ